MSPHTRSTYFKPSSSDRHSITGPLQNPRSATTVTLTPRVSRFAAPATAHPPTVCGCLTASMPASSFKSAASTVLGRSASTAQSSRGRPRAKLVQSGATTTSARVATMYGIEQPKNTSTSIPSLLSSRPTCLMPSLPIAWARLWPIACTANDTLASAPRVAFGSDRTLFACKSTSYKFRDEFADVVSSQHGLLGRHMAPDWLAGAIAIPILRIGNASRLRPGNTHEMNLRHRRIPISTRGNIVENVERCVCSLHCGSTLKQNMRGTLDHPVSPDFDGWQV